MEQPPGNIFPIDPSGCTVVQPYMAVIARGRAWRLKGIREDADYA